MASRGTSLAHRADAPGWAMSREVRRARAAIRRAGPRVRIMLGSAPIPPPPRSRRSDRRADHLRRLESRQPGSRRAGKKTVRDQNRRRTIDVSRGMAGSGEQFAPGETGSSLGRGARGRPDPRDRHARACARRPWTRDRSPPRRLERRGRDVPDRPRRPRRRAGCARSRPASGESVASSVHGLGPAGSSQTSPPGLSILGLVSCGRTRGVQLR